MNFSLICAASSALGRYVYVGDAACDVRNHEEPPMSTLPAEKLELQFFNSCRGFGFFIFLYFADLQFVFVPIDQFRVVMFGELF